MLSYDVCDELTVCRVDWQPRYLHRVNLSVCLLACMVHHNQQSTAIYRFAELPRTVVQSRVTYLVFEPLWMILL